VCVSTKSEWRKKSRDRIVADWYFQDTFGYTGPPVKVESQNIYFKILIEMTSADGTFSDQEQQWVMGLAATVGEDSEVIY
jgi:hypothetical protein